MEIKNFTTDIDKFLDGLEKGVRSRVLQVFDMLELCGNEIGMPYSKSLGSGLFELRISGKIHIRIIYCFYQNNVILLHAFIKKADKIPKKELYLAKRRHKSIL
ncbi:MAG: type II toxin-antitoxin system RelE/ParE family toxin [Candidatus Nomurabacteria bacterium]|nr:type II toxin-antitoxin system RelE/ParE family toxin [Candidatus Nomurabacteria bacterium]